MQKIYQSKPGKVAGMLRDGVYHKLVIRSKHLMRMFNGYGIDKKIFDDLKKEDCLSIKISELDTGDTYTCSFDLFDARKILKDFDGEQYFIEGKHLTKYE